MMPLPTPMTAAAVALALTLLASPARADLVIDSDAGLVLDVDYFVGSGVNTSYVIIDFAATGGDAYAFGFRWSEAERPTGFDMLTAVTTGGGLDFTFENSQFGTFVTNFTYAPFGEVGAPENFWAYWTAEPGDIDPGVDWTFSSVGVTDRVLADGSLDGWYNGFDDPLIAPRVPTVPAPATALAIGAVLLVRPRRRSASS